MPHKSRPHKLYNNVEILSSHRAKQLAQCESCHHIHKLTLAIMHDTLNPLEYYLLVLCARSILLCVHTIHIANALYSPTLDCIQHLYVMCFLSPTFVVNYVALPSNSCRQ